MKNHWKFLTNTRSFSAFMHDVLAAIFAWLLSFLFRFNFDVPPNFMQHLYQTIFWVVSIQASVFIAFGLYQGVWRFASIPDLKRIIKAVCTSTVLVVAAIHMLNISTVVPRSVLILDPILLILFIGGSRFAYRAWKEHRLYGGSISTGKPVIIIGAGDLGVSLLKN